MEEIWKPVVGFEGLYEVSSLGNIRSLDTLVFRGNGVNQINGQRLRGRVMAQRRDSKGYARINLYGKPDESRKRKKHCLMVHRIVAEAFHSDSPDFGSDVNHIDFDPSNNAASNLEWVTRKKNLRHSAQAGRLVGARGRRGKFTSATWAEVIKQLAAGVPPGDVSLSTGVPILRVNQAGFMFKDLMGYITSPS